MITTTAAAPIITWEKLPDDYRLPDDPVDNRTQPLLAEALSDALRSNDRINAQSITSTNYGICATFNGKIVIKAPDWAYIPRFSVPPEEIERSYTPQLQGDFPQIVMEFVSETEGGEYSTKPTYPPGKWFFYEQILRVPVYVIFAPHSNSLECYRLNDRGQYAIETPNGEGRHWLPELNLHLGTWLGTALGRTGSWLRWWDEGGNLLLWNDEKLAQERQRTERLLAQLRAAGIEPDLD